MSKPAYVAVKDLSLDLKNYRMMPQSNEAASIHAMISIGPDEFWDLMNSLLDNGYEAIENIIVLKLKDQLVVMEGNRRVGAMKLIKKLVSSKNIEIPEAIEQKIEKLPSEWHAQNSELPCVIYGVTETAKVDEIVARIHGRKSKAQREEWESVATARHNRDKHQKSEPALDLLEKYLKTGKNITPAQSERWAGVYHLTVLHEALPSVAQALGFKSANELSAAYPETKKRKELENLLASIGLNLTGFPQIRDGKTSFLVTFGFSSAPLETGSVQDPPPGGANSSSSTPNSSGQAASTGTQSQPPTHGQSTPHKATKAVAIENPSSVRRKLNGMTIRGKNREKVVSLQDEMKRIKLEKTPYAFCFLLRSMFEISAKAYCGDHKIPTSKAGKDLRLIDILDDAARHMTNNFDKSHPMTKPLYGSMKELGNTKSILSVDSLNQLIHSDYLSVHPSNICSVFNNVFPLLKAMNG